MSELSVRDEEIEQLRQEITLIRNSNEQRFHEYNVETRRLITEAENEKNKAISESKTANEALDKLHMDLAFLEKSLQEEKEGRLKLLSLTYEKNLPEDDEDQTKILHSQYQKHMSELQNELQVVKINENQLKDQLSITITEKESLRDQLNSMEKDLKQWQNLTKSTSESKNAEIESLNLKIENLTVEYEKTRHQASHFEIAYKDQVTITQRTQNESSDREKHYNNVLEKLTNETLSLKKLNELYEKQQENDKQKIEGAEMEINSLKSSLNNKEVINSMLVEETNKLKEGIKNLEEEKQRLNELFAVESGSPIEQALRHKGKSIINMYDEYTQLQEQFLQQRKINHELTQVMTTFKFEIENYVPYVNQKNEECNRLLEENNIISEQLTTINSKIQQINKQLEDALADNKKLNDQTNQLQLEKEMYLNHNIALIRQIEELRKGGGPNSPIIVQNGDELPRDLKELYKFCFDLKSSKYFLLDRVKNLEKDLESMQSVLDIKESENQNNILETKRLQACLQQLNAQIETSERDHAHRNSLISRASPSNSQNNSFSVSDKSFGEKSKGDYNNLKKRYEIAMEELTVREETIKKLNKELGALRYECKKSSIECKNLEERYSILNDRSMSKDNECNDLRRILLETQQLNESMESRLIMTERDKSDLVIQLEDLKKELDTRQSKWEELQTRFNTEIDSLVASKNKRNEITKEVQSLTDDKERLNNDIGKAQENLSTAEIKIENLQQQINDLNEKNSLEMLKLTDENAKLIEKNKDFQQEIEKIQEENKVHSEAIDAKVKEIEKCKEQLVIFESNEQGVKISKLKSELETFQKENEQLLEDSKKLKELCDKYKADVNENNKLYYELKTATDKERDENTALIKKLQEEIPPIKEELNKKVEELESKTQDLLVANEELSKIMGLLNEANNNLNAKEKYYNDELDKQKNILEEVRNNYNRELIAHAACVQNLNELNDKNTQLNADLENLKNQLHQSESTLKTEKEHLENTLLEAQNRCKELENENNLLHGYFDTHVTEKTPTEQIISLLRRDKEKLATQLEIVTQQGERYKAQLDQSQKSLNEVHELLNQEREKFEKSESLEQRKAELQAKDSQMKILNESNKTLRAECTKFEVVVSNLQASLKNSEEKIITLEAQAQTLDREKNEALQEVEIIKNDNERWNARFQSILQKYGINDPAELQNLKENLKTLTENLKTCTEEKDKFKAEYTKLKNDYGLLRKQCESLRASAIRFKTRAEQLDKDKAQFTQEKTQLTQEFTQATQEKTQLTQENLKLEKEKAQLTQDLQKEKATVERARKQFSHIQKTNQQKLESQTQSSEQSKKELEDFKQQNQEASKKLEESEQQKQELTKELKEMNKKWEEILKELKEEREKSVEYMRIKAQESMFSSKIKRLEAEKEILIQKLQPPSLMDVDGSEKSTTIDRPPEASTQLPLEIPSSTPQIVIEPPTSIEDNKLESQVSEANVPSRRSDDSSNAEQTSPIPTSNSSALAPAPTPTPTLVSVSTPVTAPTPTTTPVPTSTPAPVSVPTLTSTPAPMTAPTPTSTPAPVSIPTPTTAPTPVNTPSSASAPSSTSTLIPISLPIPVIVSSSVPALVTTSVPTSSAPSPATSPRSPVSTPASHVSTIAPSTASVSASPASATVSVPPAPTTSTIPAPIPTTPSSPITVPREKPPVKLQRKRMMVIPSTATPEGQQSTKSLVPMEVEPTTLGKHERESENDETEKPENEPGSPPPEVTSGDDSNPNKKSKIDSSQ